MGEWKMENDILFCNFFHSFDLLSELLFKNVKRLQLCF